MITYKMTEENMIVDQVTRQNDSRQNDSRQNDNRQNDS